MRTSMLALATNKPSHNPKLVAQVLFYHSCICNMHRDISVEHVTRHIYILNSFLWNELSERNVQKTSSLQLFSRMNIKEAPESQTVQNFTFPCCIFLLTYDIHLDKKIHIRCALIQHDLQQEDVIKLFCLCQLAKLCLAALLDMTWTMTL